MESYVVRIYRRDEKESHILIGSVERPGTDKRMGFSNIEELWEILRHRKGRGPFAPPSPRRRLRKEVMSTTAVSDLEASAEGVRQTKPTSGH